MLLALLAAVDGTLLPAFPCLARMEHASKIGWLTALMANGEGFLWISSRAFKVLTWPGSIFFLSKPLSDHIVGW